MFTPQKSWWSLTPSKDQSGSAVTGSGSAPKGGYSSPRNGDAVEKGNIFTPSSAEKFTHLDKDALCEKISDLHNELLEYQYNMGLLLIEKKDWTSKYEELKQSLAELDDAHRREQSAHLIAISEVEKREENLRNALGIEKQCVVDLEKALREMRSEHAEIKFTADSKLAEAKSLVAIIEQKSLELEVKLRAADAKLAEVNRKTSELERKSQELVAQENTLKQERLSFTAECGVQEAILTKQREDLREWEQKLHVGEERLAEARRLLNQREQRANENDNIWKQKQKDLEDIRKKVDEANLTLKEKEEDLTNRQASLSLKEKEADKMRKSLDLKGKQLIELEEKLNSREKVEMQKLLDEHKANLDTKEKEFELELEQKRKAVDQELKTNAAEVQKKEAELNHIEEKIRKRELVLEKKLEKVKDKEIEFELKSKDLKESEKSLKVEAENIENERKEMLTEKENLSALKIELEKIRSDVDSQQLKIREETQLLKVTEEERSEHARLQLELKLEIDKCRVQRELLLKEADDLKLERLRFELEWEEQDDKRAEVSKELEDIAEQKKNFEKMRWSEEERLNREKVETQNYVKRELEALEVARESFSAAMDHERTMLEEKAQSDKRQTLNEFEMQKRQLEADREKQQEEMEYRLREMERSFEEKREVELHNIKHLRDLVHREREEMKAERHGIEKEKQEISSNKEKLETQHLEMRKDIDDLVSLSRKLKNQREQLIKERERFIAFVENLKSCSSCVELINEFVLSDLQSFNEIENAEDAVLPRVAENYFKDAVHGMSQRANTNPRVVEVGSPASGGTISWLQKCTTRMFRFSPGKNFNLDAAEDLNGGASPGNLLGVESGKPLLDSEIQPEISLGFADDSLDIQNIQSDSSIREIEAGPDSSINDDQRQHSNAKVHKRGTGRKGRQRVIRPRSGLGVAADGKASEGQHVNGYANVNKEKMGESGGPTNGRKRDRTNMLQASASEYIDEYSGQSGSFTGEGHRKRKQKVALPVQNPAENRYNLRRRRSAAVAASNGIVSELNRTKDREVGGRTPAERISSSKATPSDTVEVGGLREEMQESNAAPAGPVDAKGDNGAVKSILTAHKFSEEGHRKLKDSTVAQDGVSNTASAAEGDALTSEEVNGTTPEGASNDCMVENKVEPLAEEEEEDNDDDENDEFDHPGQVSVGKKLWKFLTT